MTVHVRLGVLAAWAGHDECLSPSEVARAEALPAGGVRERAVASRAALRHALGEHLDEEPHRIRFAPRSCSHCGSARHGKPGLDADATRGVEFNLSHSSVHVAIAVADHVAVGIDIEGGLPQDPDGIARRFFTEAERQAPLTRDAFLRLWTRKEAAMKVGGRGLAAGLAFDVLADRVELDDGSVVWVRDVAAGEPCAVAAAQEGFRIEVGRLDAPGR